MKADSLGLCMVGLSIAFLIAILYGHRRRETFSQQSAQWDTLRSQVEASSKKTVDFDIAGFRKAVLDQNKFFEVEADTLDETGRAIGVPLGIPAVADVKNTNRMFDEKIRLLSEEMTAEAKKKTPESMIAANTSGLGIAVLKTLAKNYMLRAIDGKPKGWFS